MLNLSDHFREARPKRAIFTTFALSPSLFDTHLVRRLLEEGCEEILLLTDRAGYEALLAERSAITYAGCSYWVCRVDVSPFVFHPKVALMWSEDEARVYVMSANLTHGGLWRNAEVVDLLSWNRHEGGPVGGIRKAAEWCKQLPDALRLPDAIRAAIHRMLGELTSVLPAAAEDGTGAASAQFVHNLTEAILPQVLRLAPDGVDEVLVAAPFYAPDLEPVARILERFPKAKFTAAQESKTGTIDPSIPEKLKRRIKVATCRLKGSVRPWHAKVILMKGRREWLLATGSTNITTAALLRSADKGNVEAAVIRVATDKAALSRLVDELLLTPVSWTALRYKPIAAESTNSAGPAILWAEITGLRLRVDVTGVDLQDAGCVRNLSLLVRTGSRSGLAFTATAAGAGRITVEAVLPPDIDSEFGSSLFVDLEARHTSRTPYCRLSFLVMCPDEINAPVAIRRFRSAVRAMQRQEMQTDDIREVLGFVQQNLSGMLIHLQSQSTIRRVDSRKAESVPLPDRPAVTHIDEGAPSFFRILAVGRLGTNLLAELPLIFRGLLQPTTRMPTSGETVARNTDDESEDPDQDDDSDAPEYDPDALADDARAFLDWVVESSASGPDDDESAVREWPVRAYLLEFSLAFARFYYVRGEAAIDRDTPAWLEYLSRIRSLLTCAVSAAGLAWSRPDGWFVRAKQRDRELRCSVSPTFAAQVLFQEHELLSGSNSGDAAELRVRPLLEGLDLAFGERVVEDSVDVRSALGLLLTTYRQPETRFGEIVEFARALRKIETPEQQALTKFRLLLSLQEATGVVHTLRAKPLPDGAPRPELAIAMAIQLALKNECARLHPQETSQYLELVSKGRWRSLMPVRDGDAAACPACNMGLPMRLAANLKNVTKMTPCPSCFTLIIPIPIGPGVGRERREI